MKEHGILFKQRMHKAIIDLLKTQTRRIIKPQPSFNNKSNLWGWKGYLYSSTEIMRDDIKSKAPLGKTGDRLYIKESYRGYYVLGKKIEDNPDKKLIAYKMDSVKEIDERWISPLFMPKTYARTWMEIKSVRVERIQDISEDDSIAEGIKKVDGYYKLYECLGNYTSSAKMSFKKLWDSINAKPKPVYINQEYGGKIIYCYESYPWESPIEPKTEYRGKPLFTYPNPWVFVYEFEVINER